jgi:hypothetical protein
MASAAGDPQLTQDCGVDERRQASTSSGEALLGLIQHGLIE